MLQMHSPRRTEATPLCAGEVYVFDWGSVENPFAYAKDG